ncbi:hypothetical protein ABZ816_01755 [Actinosynnema sp. NPDC047251]|uniref:hypothetical protein n=1 Tax=Saccharothrix espanaensis TaxID=103731 RepID=UPI0003138CB2|nr:hypothetical protein [Saccharothrix espanaensis]
MRKRIWSLTVALTLATPLPATAADSPWQTQPVEARGALTAVSSGPEGTWAFGEAPDGRSFALRGAEDWQRVPIPDVGRVHHAQSGWAVGRRGALRWTDGWQRVRVAERAGTSTTLQAVEIDPLAPELAWAVGAETVPGTQWRRGVVQRWDGTAWRGVPVPDGLLDTSSELTGVAPRGGDEVFVYGIDHDRSGSRVVVLRYAGGTWTNVPVSRRAGYDEQVVGHNSEAARLVGWTAPVGAPASARRPLVLRVNPDNREVVRERVPATAAELTGVTSEYGTPLAVGHTADGRPYAVRLSGDSENGTWIADPVPPVRGRLLAVAGIVVPNIWAVGVTAANRPLVLRDEP